MLIGAVFIFVFKIGVIDGKYFSDLALKNLSVNFAIPPPRGIIFDHFGAALTKNVPSFDLLVVSRELKGDADDTGETISKVAQILNLPGDSLAALIAESSKKESMFFAAKGLEKDQALAIKYLNPGGFYIISNTKRQYVDGHKFSQIVGYTGQVSKNDFWDDYYFPTDTIGRLGLEAQYEKYLRGEHGNIFFIKDDSGNNTANEPNVGNSLITTIDFSLQKKLYDEVFEVLRQTNLSRAAAVIQNPNTGAVLGLVSFPSFDNNLFNDDLSVNDYKRLFENPSKPLFNRIISGLYNPGSTIKPFMGLAALEEGTVTSKDTIQDCISLTVPNPYNPELSRTFSNWRVEYGPFNLKKAIANSCNIYFFAVGGGLGKIKGLGIEKIAGYLGKAFADSVLGIDLPGEEAGFVPTPDWKLSNRGENWYLGDTYNVSIGQGDLLITPLWLNSYTSAIANGGTFYQPRIVDKIIDENKNVLETMNIQILGRLPFRSEFIDEIKNDMREAVVSGTAQLLNGLPVKAAAKTGTAEVVKGRSINSLFVSFAPLENPEIAITVLIEGSASNQGLAVRVANNVLKWYFERMQNEKVKTQDN
ncbi:MAG: hypothetical protein A3B99_04790 [Candidatus Yanofskybacteria bacterium RIFCSPHIGHO2_02_FULL_44_12b]|nr:MAG: hypothetical protein A3B99_04790 [Candidatus Yanofskybacteria bacterium RIFCSPHIGHO2_02_FULL_44_12b]